jgi:hypothetical protein
MCELTTQYRQQDTRFVAVLNDVRTGLPLAPESVHELEQAQYRDLSTQTGVIPTRLCPKNTSVDDQVQMWRMQCRCGACSVVLTFIACFVVLTFIDCLAAAEQKDA